MVLAGKRRLSVRAKRKVAERLGLSATETQALVKESETLEEATVAKDLQLMALDSFAFISDWYHLAILSLLELDKLKLDAKQIARYLGIHEQEAAAALARLARMDLITKVRGRWKQNGDAILFNNTNSTAATIRFNKQILERAIHSIENDPFERRTMSASTFEMNSQLVPMARQELKALRRKLSEKLKSSGKADQVYCLSLQLFPLTRIEKKIKGDKDEN